MLQESGIYTGQLLILEVKNVDGMWPGEVTLVRAQWWVAFQYLAQPLSTAVWSICTGCCVLKDEQLIFLLSWFVSQNPTCSNDTSTSLSLSYILQSLQHVCIVWSSMYVWKYVMPLCILLVYRTPFQHNIVTDIRVCYVHMYICTVCGIIWLYYKSRGKLHCLTKTTYSTLKHIDKEHNI